MSLWHMYSVYPLKDLTVFRILYMYPLMILSVFKILNMYIYDGFKRI